jgi:hypothetical protein
MSIKNLSPEPNAPNPPLNASVSADLEALVERVVHLTMTELGFTPAHSLFVRSSECAQILGVTPEHLCAMRGRGEGPSWSGTGRWVRYRRSDVLNWLATRPRSKPSISNDQMEMPNE